MTAAADLLTPIPGDNPAGSYLRFDPLYDRLKEARREEDDLPQGDWQTARKTADWPLVIRLAGETLSSRSKDLQLAAWLTEGLLRHEGVGGLRQGLDTLRALLEHFWDTVYPEIEDGDAEMRAAPLEWVGTRLDLAVRLTPLNIHGHSLLDMRASRTVPTKEEAEADSGKREARERAIADGKLTAEEFDSSFNDTPTDWYRTLVADAHGAAASLAALDAFCAAQFGAVAPSFLPLRNAVEEVSRAADQLLALKLERNPDAVATPPAPVPATGPGAGPTGPEVPGPAMGVGIPRSREEAASWIAAAAAALRQQRQSDPAPYLMLRGFRWGELRSGDGALDPKLLEAPTTELRTRLKTLRLDARWTELLETAEGVMAAPQGRGWLDLQRHILHACDALGGEYDAVGSAIRGALRSLLADVPELPGMTLMDDSPTANAETLEWLRQEELLPPGDAATTAAPERPRPAARRDAYEVARERARGGDPRGAMSLLMREAMQEKSARARFLRRAQAADIMVEAGLETVALPVLRELFSQVETHRLEEWEAGETIAHPYGLLYRCLTRLDSDEVDRRDLYERICRLDPVQAVHLGDTGNGQDEGS
jgi:type VI secretion system protein ImpA